MPSKSCALQRQQLRQRGAPLIDRLRQDHLAHRADLALAEEHVLGAAQPDAFGAEGDGVGALVRLIGVGAHLQPALAVRPLHELRVLLVHRRRFRIDAAIDEHAHDFAGLRRHAAEEHLAGGAVDRDVIALLEDRTRPGDAHLTCRVVDGQRFAAGDAHLPHLPRDQRGVAGHAAARRQNALGGRHAADVLGRGLDAHQDHRVAPSRRSLGVLRVEHDLPRCCTGAGVEAARQQAVVAHGLLLVGGAKGRSQQLVELLGLDAQQRLVRRDQPLLHHVDGDANGRRTGALADAALQHVEPAPLDGELDVHHVAVVPLERTTDLHQLRIDLRVLLLERAERQRRARAGDDVLALRVHQELAVEDVLAGRWVAREGDTGPRVVTEVAEDHRLHVHRRAPAFGNAVQLAVGDGAVVHPRAEDRADGAPQLLLRVFGKLNALAFADRRLELVDQLAQIVGGQLGIELDAARVLLALQDLLERVDLGLRLRLQIEHDVAVHRDEAAVRVVGEARVAGERDQALHGLVVEAEVEDGVHHARHRGARAGAHRHQQRVGWITELAAEHFLDAL